LREAEKKTETPSEWIEKHFYVPDPRDPVTDERLPPGPLRLANHQKRIIDEALSHKPNGDLKYSTIIYSAPKKSGKSAITSAVALYTAHQNSNTFIACLANDGKQSADRLYGPIYTNFRLHRQLGGIFKDIHPNKTETTLPNYTTIEAIPCDAAGEAGSQPMAVFFSELWGYESASKRRLFTELTIPPTLYGKAFRWIESYAGYTGVSELLEGIYVTGFLRGEPHPNFLDLEGKYGPVVRVNEPAGMFMYWDTEPRMPWQTTDYYQQEAAILEPTEFRRIHRNEWVSPISSFIEDTWWEACHDARLPPLADNDRTPVVVGIDMAVSRDCAALVAVSRDPYNPDTKIAVRAVKIFSPKKIGGIIDQEMMVRPIIEDWARRWNVVCWVYDPREMAKLAQDLVRAGVGWFKPFGQASPRAISDKQLHDMIVHQQITWNRDTTYGDVGFRGGLDDSLYKHISQAGATTRGDSYRLEKLSNQAKIDAAVALSQAAYVAMQLSIGNSEFSETSLIKQLQNHEITLEEFSSRVRKLHPRLEERMNEQQQ
jgi:hypothetical protein